MAAVAELRPLPRGVEHHVVADTQEFVEVLLRVRRGEHVILAPERLRHLLIAELCFEYAAGGHAVEVLRYQRVDRERRERFLCQEYLAPGFLADVFQQLEIFPQRGFVYDVAGCFYFVFPVHGVPFLCALKNYLNDKL